MTFGPALTIATVAAITASAGTEAFSPPGQPTAALLGVTAPLLGRRHDLVHEDVVVPVLLQSRYRFLRVSARCWLTSRSVCLGQFGFALLKKVAIAAIH